MSILNHLWIATGSFFILALLFWPLERAFPANNTQKLFRPEWFTDLLFFLGQYFLWATLATTILVQLQITCFWMIPLGLQESFSLQPWILQAIQVVLLGDILIYWVHRLQHKIDILWRFHAVHHTAEHLDWLAAHREHPIDGLITQAAVNLPAFILGFPLSTIFALIVFRGIWAIYIHSNVRIPLGPFHILLGSSETHHWHHSKTKTDCNFGNLSPLMDIIFGTYYCPSHEPEELGIKEYFPRSYLKQLAYPLFKNKIK